MSTSTLSPAGTMPETPHRRPSGLALAALALAQFMVTLDSSIVNVALPSIQRDLDVSAAGLSWVVDGYLVSFAGLLLLGGRLSDLLPRRGVFQAGLSLFVVASAACATAPTGPLLVLARLLQGAGGALLAPAALSLVMTMYADGPGRARALGVWGAVSGAGGVAGVLLGGALSQHLGWPAIFVINVPVGLVSGILVARMVPRLPGHRGASDLLGALTVTLGIGAAVLGLVEGPSAGWASVAAWGPLTLGVTLLVAFVLVERRTPAPLVPLSVVTRPALLVANALMLALGAVMVGLFYFLPQYQQHVLGMSPTRTGLTQLPIAAAITVSGLLARRVGRLLGSARLALVLALVALVGGIGWVAPARAGVSALELVAPFLLIGVGLGLGFVYITTLAVAAAEPHEAGLASGLVNTTRQVGGAVGLAALTAVSTGPGGPDLTRALVGAAVLAAVGLVLACLPALRRTH